ncbi:MAG TPA: AAA family ATPase [Planctomycetota bacterium]|nr:AAA family ATPase [Planctomycetota bacterium]
MVHVPRLHTAILREHFAEHRQMALLAGPRQVGKTTVCRTLDHDPRYLNWDDRDDRRLILRGPKVVAAELDLARLREDRPLVVFDELHKHRKWKQFLKGFFDGHADRVRIAVTGSAQLDVYRRGGDSLMGRYLLYRISQLSVGELLRQGAPASALAKPERLGPARYAQLLQRGGFPEPFLKDGRFGVRWRELRRQQLVREDVRDLARVQDLDQLEVMEALLRERSGRTLTFSELANTVHVTVETASRWVALLAHLHHGFLLRPWFANVTKSLRKEPKWYQTDWAGVDDAGARAETFVACHLLKAVQTWQDVGFGRFELRYLRDKNQREVDFCVVRDGKPWFLAEVKKSGESLSPALAHFQRQTKAKHAFQVVVDLPFVGADPFERNDPCVVPAATLLSMLP